MVLASPGAPTRRDLQWFGAILAVFFAIVGGLVWWQGGGLLVLAGILAAAWLAYAVFNRESTDGRVLGALIPAIMATAGGAVASGSDPRTVAVTFSGVGLVAAIIFYSVPPLRLIMYHAWMRAAHPIGWSISNLLLAMTYYLVVTPIGIALRATGRDPMQRKLRSGDRSYWTDQQTGSSADDYFNQY